MAKKTPKLGRLIIGVGNPLCADDGVGPLVAHLLSQDLRFVTCMIDGSMSSLMEAWKGVDDVLIVDAARCDRYSAGTILVFDAAKDLLPAWTWRRSTHELGVNQAIELSRALGQLPERVIVAVIIGRVFAPLTLMTPAVREAALKLTSELLSGHDLNLMSQQSGRDYMHETRLMQDLVRRIDEIVLAEGGSKAVSVSVRLGAFSPLSKEHFRDHFIEESKGRCSEGASIEIITSEDIQDPLAKETVLESVIVA